MTKQDTPSKSKGKASTPIDQRDHPMVGAWLIREQFNSEDMVGIVTLTSY